jgi:hypothetical protein
VEEIIEHLAYAPRAHAPEMPELPSTVNDRHQQQSANTKLTRALNPRATYGNTAAAIRAVSGVLRG